ncbi:ATPase, partial [candidate division KSB3 bacterium]|nr:ATPase [candidate division KSB3 bacterium]MBD3325179.1 ATPase [candidate division KSB3 bacterium]
MNDIHKIQTLQQNIERIIIGKPDVIRLAIITLFA